ncbi:MarR family winged helix-turn-helix transcriptional regulator [Protofrankia symbiont of Coriaria ruscifolia]|uniref:Regulatory protein MarR n=1 Tax=Candidatus Protofrankia californiensis TaxID=1839754 RepID=A0A1C3PGE2_9ACTN|nr:MarR family winged helix-turn-helix transcriptional regulator [Protofrankia symbiont of Coriaria ruscifolia]SBW28912.1 regulatory protein MarR [Candidatus Protofrankia californiensis]
MSVTATTPGSIVLLTRLARRVYREATDGVLGMTLKQFVVLNHLSENAGVPQRQLGDVLCLDANNLVLLLNEIERAGWAERRRDPTDRRRHLVYRTHAGSSALAAAERGMDAVEDRILDTLSTQERATLRFLLAAALTEETALSDRK